MMAIQAITVYGLKKAPEAFKHLVETYQGMVYCACNRVLGSPAEAEEGTEETFLKLADRVGFIELNPAC